MASTGIAQPDRKAFGRLAPALERLMRHRRPLIVVFHLLLTCASSYSAMWLRFDGPIPETNYTAWLQALPWLVVIRGLAFAWFGLYQGLWRYAGIWDLRNIGAAIAASSFAHYALAHWVLNLGTYPRSVSIIDSFVLVLAMGGVRLTRRMLNELTRVSSGRRRILIFGAGDAGEAVARDMRNRGDYHPIGFVDDDVSKIGQHIHGIPVLGTRYALAAIMERYQPDEIVLAIPRANPELFRQLVRSLDQYEVPIKTIPTLREILESRVEVSRIRSLSLEDLLSRKPVGLDEIPVRQLLRGSRVLVTGAGGSIGSELCRQIAALGASELVMLDRSEAGLFHIANELADQHHGHGTVCHTVIGDVTDRVRIEQVLRQYAPQILFHAAAHKHVPLMETNPCEAVKNNVIGTRVVAECAEAAGVARFVLISTDKAVHPSSVMGVTKRIGELLVQDRGSATTFVTVRFGNVLASSGSVVPHFLKQIKAGGPVTVTHPDMRRFFMLIPEAVQLVLHAAADGEAGRLYVLEMGEQIKLVDLARHLIRLSGYVPDDEIAITFIGLRPGDRLCEQLTGDDELVSPSSIPGVMVVQPSVLRDEDELLAAVNVLSEDACRGNEAAVLRQFSAIVPAFDRRHESAPVMPPSQESVPVMPVSQEVPQAAAAMTTAGSGPVAWQRQRCPDCGSVNVHRSRVRSRLEQMRRRLSMKRLYRCWDCGWRGWIVPIVYVQAGDVFGDAVFSPGSKTAFPAGRLGALDGIE